MRRHLFALLCVCLCCLNASGQYRNSYSDLYEGDVCSSMRQQCAFLSSEQLGGRKAGSEGEASAAAYVKACLESAGVDIISGRDGQTFGILQESGDTLRSRNVAGIVSGYDNALRERYIVIGARLDNLGQNELTVNGEKTVRTYYGANGNASGLSMLIQLGKMLATNKIMLKRSVILVAFGASVCGNVGSWYFLDRGFGWAGNIDAMINLDMLGTPSSGFYAYTSSNSDLNRLVSEQAGTLQPVHPELVTLEPVKSDHRSFYAKEIPSIFFTSGMYPQYNTFRDTPDILEYEGMERELEYIYNFTVALANGKAPEFRQSAPKGEDSGVPGVVSYSDCDVLPTFLGSPNPTVFLSKWVYKYLKYPQEAVDRGIQGRVLLDFVIDAKGKVRDVKVRKGVDELLDAEAVKVVAASPDWKPGRVRGKKVSTSMSMYVEFRLKRNKRK